MLSKIMAFMKKNWMALVLGLAAFVVMALLMQSMAGSESLMSYRFLGNKAALESDDVMPAGTYQPVTELPVGGTGAKLGSTTTWFARGGMEGGMDKVDPSTKGFSDPDRWDAPPPRPAGGDVSGAGLIGHAGLLPDGAADTGDLLAGGLALKPQMSSWKDGTRTRDQTLSARGDVANPVGSGPSPEASLSEEPSDSPVAAKPVEAFSLW